MKIDDIKLQNNSVSLQNRKYEILLEFDTKLNINLTFYDKEELKTFMDFIMSYSNKKFKNQKEVIENLEKELKKLKEQIYEENTIERLEL